MTDTSNTKGQVSSEFLSHIEFVIKIDASEKKTAEDTIFNLWKGLLDFYKSVLKENESISFDYGLIEIIHDIIEESYGENMEKSETLSTIKGLLLKHRRVQFCERNGIVKKT
jgi:hypothetical protein